MKYTITLLCLLLVTGCSSSQAGDYQNYDDNESGDYIIAPEPDEDDETSSIPGPAVIDDMTEPVFSGPETVLPDIQEDYPQTDLQDLYQSDYDVRKLHFEEFDNLYGQITYEGTPADKVLVPLGNANGVWKYNLKIRDESPSGISYFDELGYAEMSVHNNDDPPVRIILHPRLASDGYESWSETDEEVGYEPFGGRYDENDNLKLTGNDCVLLLKEYYAYEGREYLIAELWMSEEEHADFLMMRGQE